MDVVLKNLVGKKCYVLIDGVIIFSKTEEEHALRLDNVLARFEKWNLQLHPEKCVVAQPQVNYLVYVPSENGVSASADWTQCTTGRIKVFPNNTALCDAQNLTCETKLFFQTTGNYSAYKRHPLYHYSTTILQQLGIL